MDLLVRAERFDQLAELEVADVHACRRLNRSHDERGTETELRNRAGDGDSGALYHLVRWLYGAGRPQEARRAVEGLGPEDEYAPQLLVEEQVQVVRDYGAGPAGGGAGTTLDGVVTFGTTLRSLLGGDGRRER